MFPKWMSKANCGRNPLRDNPNPKNPEFPASFKGAKPYIASLNGVMHPKEQLLASSLEKPRWINSGNFTRFPGFHESDYTVADVEGQQARSKSTHDVEPYHPKFRSTPKKIGIHITDSTSKSIPIVACCQTQSSVNWVSERLIRLLKRSNEIRYQFETLALKTDGGLDLHARGSIILRWKWLYNDSRIYECNFVVFADLDCPDLDYPDQIIFGNPYIVAANLLPTDSDGASDQAYRTHANHTKRKSPEELEFGGGLGQTQKYEQLPECGNTSQASSSKLGTAANYFQLSQLGTVKQNELAIIAESNNTATMIFAIATVVFLPLSFFISCFVMAWKGDGDDIKTEWYFWVYGTIIIGVIFLITLFVYEKRIHGWMLERVGWSIASHRVRPIYGYEVKDKRSLEPWRSGVRQSIQGDSTYKEGAQSISMQAKDGFICTPEDAPRDIADNDSVAELSKTGFGPRTRLRVFSENTEECTTPPSGPQTRSKLTAEGTSDCAIPPRKVRIKEEDDPGCMNWMKSQVEEVTGETWNWWPMRSTVRSLEPDEVRVQWECVSNAESEIQDTTNVRQDLGHVHWTEVPLSAAQPLQRTPNATHENDGIPSSARNSLGPKVIVLADAESTGSSSSGRRSRGQSSISGSSSATSDGGSSDEPDEDRDRDHCQEAGADPSGCGKEVVLDIVASSQMQGFVLFGVEGAKRLQPTRTRVTQMDIEKLKDDDNFFSELVTQYRNLRGFFRRVFSIWSFRTCKLIVV